MRMVNFIKFLFGKNTNSVRALPKVETLKIVVVEFVEYGNFGFGQGLARLLQKNPSFNVRYFDEPFDKSFLNLQGRKFFDFVDAGNMILQRLNADVVVWGKVTAASAVAIAAGVLSATIMAVVEHYNSDLSLTQSFGEWLETVAKEPAVNWALAASVISISKSLDRGPVVTGIIIAVFTLFGVVEDAKEMLGKYNFSA